MAVICKFLSDCPLVRLLIRLLWRVFFQQMLHIRISSTVLLQCIYPYSHSFFFTVQWSKLLQRSLRTTSVVQKLTGLEMARLGAVEQQWVALLGNFPKCFPIGKYKMVFWMTRRSYHEVMVHFIAEWTLAALSGSDRLLRLFIEASTIFKKWTFHIMVKTSLFGISGLPN